MNIRKLLPAVAALALAAGFAAPAFAQDKWPSKPITYIVPFPAGGTTDVLARLIGQKLGPALGTRSSSTTAGARAAASAPKSPRARRRSRRSR